MHNESSTINLNWLIQLRRIHVLTSRRGFLLYFSETPSHFRLFSWFYFAYDMLSPLLCVSLSNVIFMYPYQVLILFCSDVEQHFARILFTHHLDWFGEAGRLSSRIEQIEMMPKLGTQIYNWLFVYTVSLPHFLYCPSFLCLYLQVADDELVSSMDRKDHLSTPGWPRTESEWKMSLVTP